jgi:hypothetical protein
MPYQYVREEEQRFFNSFAVIGDAAAAMADRNRRRSSPAENNVKATWMSFSTA